MPTATICRPWAALTLLTALVLGGPAQAQTAPPAWAWARAATSSAPNYPNSLITDAAGNTYVAAAFTSPLTLAPGVVLTPQGTSSDAYVAKYDPTGTLLWARQLTGPGGESAAQLALDAAGNVYLAGGYGNALQVGTLSLPAPANSGIYLVRLDSQGQPTLLRQLGTGATVTTLGLDAAGNAYVSGAFSNAVTLGTTSLSGPNAVSIYLAKYDAQGTVQWARQGGSIPFVNSSVTSYTHFVTISPAGDAYLSWGIHPSAGSFAPLAAPPAIGDYDVTLVRYDTQGTPRWQQRYGTTRLDYAGATALDGSGHLLATMSFDGTTAATVSGQTLTGTGQLDAALLQLDAATGALLWVRALATTGRTDYAAVAVDAAGNSYVTGSLTGTATVGSQTLSSDGGGTDALVASYSPQGTLRWTQKAGGSGNEFARFISLTGTGELSVGGTFTQQAQFGPTLLTSANAQASSFVAHLGPQPTAAAAARPRTLGFYPNPATDLVRLPALAPGTRVQLVDAAGRLVREAVVTPAAQVSVRGLAPGLYALRATDAQGQPYAGRLVVE